MFRDYTRTQTRFTIAGYSVRYVGDPAAVTTIPLRAVTTAVVWLTQHRRRRRQVLPSRAQHRLYSPHYTPITPYQTFKHGRRVNSFLPKTHHLSGHAYLRQQVRLIRLIQHFCFLTKRRLIRVLFRCEILAVRCRCEFVIDFYHFYVHKKKKKPLTMYAIAKCFMLSLIREQHQQKSLYGTWNAVNAVETRWIRLRNKTIATDNWDTLANDCRTGMNTHTTVVF